MVRRLLVEQGRHDLVECAQLLVSEVVTNALMHSGTSIDVAMRLRDDGLLVEVGDGSQHLPSPRYYEPTASTGRGLALLEQAAASWGVVPGIHGKTVWFQLDSPLAVEPVPLDGESDGRAPVVPLQSSGSTVRVELLNVPLLLHAAWQQHAEATLREFLLASMPAESAPDLLATHAETTDALAVLKEQVPEPVVEIEPDVVMSTAVDPDLSCPRVVLAMPTASMKHYATLDDVLTQAQRMAAAGELLVPVMQPELAAFCRWVCTEIAEQYDGRPAREWPPRGDLDAPALRDSGWDSSVVTSSAEAVVAADDSDLIVAVSRPAGDLLGYHPDDLVGCRLIELIPPRYHQAHLAGFTMHLLTGRGPLLDRSVVVPVLRRDGSELPVELTVRAQRLDDGRSVFVASLQPE